MKYILNISIYLSFLKVIKTLHPMISMWSVFYTYTFHSIDAKGHFSLVLNKFMILMAESCLSEP